MRKSLLLAWIVLLLSAPFFAFSQTRQITGTVNDENGAPLPSVSVVQKGTTNGTVTGESGTFVIAVSGANPVLLFSYSGRQTRELA
ncbi:MAG: carboxypeptidase-like regulatory domain-containing protein, partial [Chitinophagaceae bacterium]|nr:carboxypeptidase-like regulatory domain-containing protein [Chitinophagaceae bacterium]